MNQKRSPLSKMVNTFFRFGEGKLFVQQVCASIPCPVQPALLCTVGSDLFIKDPLQVGVLDGSSDITEQVFASLARLIQQDVATLGTDPKFSLVDFQSSPVDYLRTHPVIRTILMEIMAGHWKKQLPENIFFRAVLKGGPDRQPGYYVHMKRSQVQLYQTDWNRFTMDEMHAYFREQLAAYQVTVLPTEEVCLRLLAAGQAALDVVENRTGSTAYRLTETDQVFQCFQDGQSRVVYGLAAYQGTPKQDELKENFQVRPNRMALRPTPDGLLVLHLDSPELVVMASIVDGQLLITGLYGNELEYLTPEEEEAVRYIRKRLERYGSELPFSRCLS